MNKKGLIKRHAREFDFLMRFLDLGVLVFSGFMTLYWSFGTFFVSREQATIGLIVVLVWLVVSNVHTNLYRPWRGISLWVEIGDVSWVLFLVLVTVGVVLYDVLDIAEFIPNMLFVKWLVVGWVMLVIYRVALRHFLRWIRKKGYNRRRIIIAGAGDLGSRVVRELTQATWTGLDIIAYFDDKYTEKGSYIVDGIPVMGTLDDLHTFVQENPVEQVWIALPLRAELRVRTLLKTLRHSTIDVLFIPDIFSFDLLNHSITQIAGIAVMNLSTSPMVGVSRMIKAVEDRIVAAVILLMISPIMLAISIGIKFGSPGPVIFRQQRHGWEGMIIEVWKFRTMKVHQEEGGKVTLATKNDSRITPFGSFLRRTSLDELPQFINVLQGRLSVVGPRPQPVEINHEFMENVNQYMKRHKVKPGITGWAQVHGLRGDMSDMNKVRKRIEHDLYYIENWSLRLDLKIIFMTLFYGFYNKNAY